jgi:hypothetical protein
MHCDDYASAYDGHPAARWFIFVNRLPASLRILTRGRFPDPACFADYQGKRVRLVMASRLGDIGITDNLDATDGYQLRVGIDGLSNFSELPEIA